LSSAISFCDDETGRLGHQYGQVTKSGEERSSSVSGVSRRRNGAINKKLQNFDASGADDRLLDTPILVLQVWYRTTSVEHGQNSPIQNNIVHVRWSFYIYFVRLFGNLNARCALNRHDAPS
jgi:hypothetical protein